MTIVLLSRLYAADAEGPRGRARGRLQGVDRAFGAGIHAVLGAPEDGTLALVEALSGGRAPSRGRAFVCEREPFRDAAIRSRIGVLGSSPKLPDARSVEALIDLARAARGDREGSTVAILDALGIGAMARRDPRALQFGEARAVEAALCLSTPSPILLVMHEPLADLAAVDLGAVQRKLEELAREGTCVVVTTSSPADAHTLGDHILLLQKGAFIGPDDGGAIGAAIERGAPLIVWVQTIEGRAGARELAASLAMRPAVRGVAWEAGGSPGVLDPVRVHGDDVDALALAITEAALTTGASIASIGTAQPSLAQIQAVRWAPSPWPATPHIAIDRTVHAELPASPSPEPTASLEPALERPLAAEPGTKHE